MNKYEQFTVLQPFSETESTGGFMTWKDVSDVRQTTKQVLTEGLMQWEVLVKTRD